MMFAKCILPAVKSRPDITQARAVRDRLARWRAGEYAALWREAVDMTRKRGKQRRKTQQQEQQSLEMKNAQRSKRLAQEGEYTRAVQALTSAGLAVTTLQPQSELCETSILQPSLPLFSHQITARS
mgnify:CR=1 FL=1